MIVAAGFSLDARERKVVRFSGKLIQLETSGPEAFIEYEDSTSQRIKKVYCDADTMKGFSEFAGNESGLFVEGKAAQLSLTSDVWVCVGRPNIRKKYSVEPPSSKKTNLRAIYGQVVEAEENGQIVYTSNGKRSHLSIDPRIAAGFKKKLERMETVEIRGNFYYDRGKGYYVEE
ncbi:hypothetical protein EHS11_09690 [Leptospira ilyithenensis]|uniref:Uncharacterized protein n=1 Tax=Leptospira ilyithenensis TaxID=2484901 RepID=A0A4R9LRK2_9LEPT|nr:hypothetical protein EHS11_09690 [Leptospira ilyithenensis]